MLLKYIGIAVLALVAVEVMLRLLFIVRPQPFTRKDKEFGWKSMANVLHSYTHPVFGDVSYSTNAMGFRSFADPNEGRKIFVVGDSFTQAIQVNDGQAYYYYLDANIFVYGCSGYGPLQESMIIDEFLDEIRPDLILWQLHANDIVNSSYDLESRSWANDLMKRPYLIDGAVKLLFPKPPGIKGFLVRYLYIAKFLKVKFSKRKQIKIPADQIDKYTAPIKEVVEKYRGQVDVVAFCATTEFDAEFNKAVKDAGAWYIPDIGRIVAKANSGHEPVTGHPQDDHWTAKGHEVAGKRIAEVLNHMETAGLIFQTSQAGQ